MSDKTSSLLGTLKALCMVSIIFVALMSIWLISENTQDIETVAEQSETTAEVTTPVAETTTEQSLLTFADKQFHITDIHKGALCLVNNENKYYDEGEDHKRICVSDYKNNYYYVTDRSIVLKLPVMDSLNNMFLDFYSATGNNDVIITSGYRSIEEQSQLYSAELKEKSASKSNLVARPEYSENHTGYAMDLAVYPEWSKRFSGEGSYSWIMQNCYNYGWVLRYPTGKEDITGMVAQPWHFRYVGYPHSQIMRKYGYTLEEYINYLRNFSYGEGHLKFTDEHSAEYEIYYVPVNMNELAPIIPVPDNREYDISGNNIDGFIVTAYLTQSIDSKPNNVFEDDKTVKK